MTEHHANIEVLQVPSENGNGNGNGWRVKALSGLVGMLIPAFAFVLWQFFTYSNTVNATSLNSLSARVATDEQTTASIQSDVSTIKSDVAFIKGLLQQKFGDNNAGPIAR